MNADTSALREMMVDGQLRTQDVTSPGVIDAMRVVPREQFVPDSHKSIAYMDEDLEVAKASADGPARYLMEPAQFGKLLQLAEIKASDLVLDVGCATGYSTAILSRLASFVFALECDPELAESATETLNTLGQLNVSVIIGPLEAGYAAEGPFDVIVLEGAVDHVPEMLLNQLAENGRLVAVIGQGNAAQAHIFVREDGLISSRVAFNAAIKPLPGFKLEKGFVF